MNYVIKFTKVYVEKMFDLFFTLFELNVETHVLCGCNLAHKPAKNVVWGWSILL